LRCVMSMRNETNLITDNPPEYCHYTDEGCDLSASCLNCPLPVCVYEVPGGKQKLIKTKRAGEMVRLRNDDNRSVSEIAALFGVSTRTVQRALKAAKNHRLKKNNNKLDSRSSDFTQDKSGREGQVSPGIKRMEPR